MNVTTKELEIILAPSSNSIAFLNALEIFLVPDSLIQDDASTYPTESYKGLLYFALETNFRVNMGGPKVDYDTLWRTWIPDDSFLENKNFAVDVRDTAIVQYRQGLATRDDAPTAVYGTCRRLNQTDPDGNFNITWNFDVDPGFQYFVRFHYCDIVSESTDEMYFNVFVNSLIVSRTLDLSALATGLLGAPVYVDFVSPVITSDKLHVSIGPTTANGNQPDAILNGLEIMKMNNPLFSLSGLAGHPSVQKSHKNQVGMIAGAIVGGVCLFALASVLFLFCRRRSKNLGQI